MAIQILTTVNPGGSPNITNVTFYESSVTPNQPSQRVTIAQFPATNPSFSRSIQISEDYLFIKRGTYNFAIPLTDLAGIAVAEVPGLSYAPFITGEPDDANCVANTSNASFVVTANSESTLSYAWRENNGSAWSANLTTAGIYDVTVAGRLVVTPTTNAQDGYGYLCILYNSAGSTNSREAILTVNDA